jgi:methyl-accepting chemotaxis protein
MKNLSIRLKLIFSIGMLAFGYLLFLGLIQWTGTSVQHHLRTASDSLFPAALAVQAAESGFQKLTKDYKDAVVLQDVKALTLAEADARNVAAQLELCREKTTDNVALQQQVVAIQGQLGSFSSLSKTTYAKLVSAPDSADAGTMAAMKTLSGQGAALVEALHNLNEEVSQKYFRGELATIAGITNQQRLLTLILFVVALAFATLTTLLLQKQISVPLRQAVEALRQVADGDLTATLTVDSGDEVGQMAAALNDALAKLRTTLHQVAANAAEASVSSQELAAAATAIASGAQRQAASLEETSASLEQITATVRQSADNARQARQVASGSTDSAERGQEVVAAAVTAMGEINTAAAKISDIISTIDEIAFQTNLLAVNAAVEAARAGEEGRGFAVVATEVRTLALRSAGAAKEIKTLIQDSLRKVEKGTELVNRSGETLHSIVGSVKAVTDIVSEIAAAAAEQSTGVDQVNTAMTQMDQVTQSNAAQTEQLSSTAKGMSEQSLRLTELVGTFVLGKEDKQARAVPPPSRGSPADRHANATTPRAGLRIPVVPTSKATRARNQAHPSAGTKSAVATANHTDDSFEEF